MNGFMYNYEATVSYAAAHPGDTSLNILNTAGCSVSNRFYNYEKISRPSETPMFTDANWRHFWASPTDRPPRAPTYNLENNGPVSTSAVTDPNTLIHPLQRAVMDRHGKAINVSFADGHAETVKLRSLWTLRWSKGWAAPASLPVIK